MEKDVCFNIMPISAVRAYQLYTAINLHMKSSYDAVKYNFVTKVNSDSLSKAKGKYFFEKLASKFNNDEQAIIFFTANIISGKKWIAEFDQKTVNEWLSYKESLPYKFSEDLKIHFEHGMNSIIEMVNQMVNSQDFTNLTFFIIFNFSAKGYPMTIMDKHFKDNVLYENFAERISKLQPLYVKCWLLDENMRKSLWEIISKNTVKTA